MQKLKVMVLSSVVLLMCSDHTLSLEPDQGRSLPVGIFSAAQIGDQPPADWEELKFGRIQTPTRYTLVPDEGTIVVKAVSRNSSSGLYRPLAIDPRQYPIIHWRWKIFQTFPREDLSLKSRDDFPARLFVMFGHDERELSFQQKARHKTVEILSGRKLPGSSLMYIWASQAPLERIATSPYSRQVKMIVVDSGSRLVGKWVEKQRNILIDYQRAYGHPAPRIIGIALMTDTDDSATHAESYYGDIILKPGP